MGACTAVYVWPVLRAFSTAYGGWREKDTAFTGAFLRRPSFAGGQWKERQQAAQLSCVAS